MSNRTAVFEYSMSVRDRSRIGSVIGIGSVMLALANLSACSSENDVATNAVVPEIKWTSCAGNGLLDCASVEVPVNYNKPDGETMQIALTRIPAEGDNRIGSLLFNPGGPGGSGTGLMNELLNIELPEQISSAYDLVGFDPRGVALSTGLNCGGDFAEITSRYPITSENVLQMMSDTRRVAEECSARYGDFLQHLGSNNVARDMDRIRLALNEEKLNFIGYSYGTRLGSLYLELFPEYSGKLILDASLPPDPDIRRLTREQVQQLQLGLNNWLAQCITIDSTCDPGVVETRLIERMGALLQQIGSTNASIAAAADEEFDVLGSLVMFSVSMPEIGEFSLAALLTYLETSDVAGLIELRTLLESAYEDEYEPPSTTYNAEVAGRAVACADDSVRSTEIEVLSELGALNQLSDFFAEAFISASALCTGWPEALDPVQPVTVQANNNVLIIGGIEDGATPLQWSQEMASAINSPLIVSEHIGHTIVFRGGNQCVDNQVVEFLVDDILPETLRCPVDVQ